MTVVFRVDASIEMGTGHVMRCLALADELVARETTCHFICREHPGNMSEIIRNKGHRIHLIPLQTESMQLPVDGKMSIHSAWLGATQEEDKIACAEILKTINPDWLVVDHYALNNLWEEALAPYCRRLMVIDDLADRAHCCDFLLDQNLGRRKQDYRKLIPSHCKVLIGPQYALLRPEFAQFREYSLNRRQTPQLKQILISMGGTDKDNVTCLVLEALKGCSLASDCRVSVIMGATAPWLVQVQEVASQMPWPTEVAVNVSNMAQRMAAADLAIGAAGSTSWERCCLGLPTLVIVLADNQQMIADGLETCGAARNLGVGSALNISESIKKNINYFIQDLSALTIISASAFKVTDGQGTNRVSIEMLEGG